jgi:hypothetical protein
LWSQSFRIITFVLFPATFLSVLVLIFRVGVVGADVGRLAERDVRVWLLLVFPDLPIAASAFADAEKSAQRSPRGD